MSFLTYVTWFYKNILTGHKQACCFRNPGICHILVSCSLAHRHQKVKTNVLKSTRFLFVLKIDQFQKSTHNPKAVKLQHVVVKIFNLILPPCCCAGLEKIRECHESPKFLKTETHRQMKLVLFNRQCVHLMLISWYRCASNKCWLADSRASWQHHPCNYIPLFWCF